MHARASTDEVSVWSPLVSRFHRFPDHLVDAIRPPTFLDASLAPSPSLPPLSPRSCRCGYPLDALCHHWSACATSGVLGRRGFPLGSVVARVSRKAGARVRTNLMVRDSDLLPHDRVDTRRLEVVADGLSLRGGVQFATETTLVSPQARDGSAKRGTDRTDGVFGGQDVERAHLLRAAGPSWSSWLRRLRASRLRNLASSWLERADSAPFLLQSNAKAGWLHRFAGLRSCQILRRIIA